jgi:Zn-dependent M32 family carboxypeptidase
MHKEPAPTAFDFVKMLSMERNAGADDLHITFAFMPQRLARTERDAMLAFKYHLLLEQKIHQFLVGSELEAQRFYDLPEEIMQSFLS